MARRKSDYYGMNFGGRPIVIHICKDGTISYRDKSKKKKVFNGFPVFAVETEEQAKAVQVRFGRKQYIDHSGMPGRPWYRWTNFSGKVEDLDNVTTEIRHFYYNELKGEKENETGNQDVVLSSDHTG